MEENNETLVETPVQPAAPVGGVVESPAPAKKGGKIVGVVVIVAILLLVIGGLVLAKSLLSSPKKVFTSAINEGYKEVELTLKDLEKIQDIINFKDHAIVLDGEVKMSTNVSEVLDGLDVDELELSGSGKIGFDLSNEIIQVEGKVKGSSETVDAGLFIQDNGAWLKTNLYEKLIDLSDELDGELNLKDVKKELDKELGDYKFEAKVYEDIAKAFKDALIKSLDSKAMSKESTKYEVAGKKVSGTKYTYTLDSKAAQKLGKELAENLLKNKDFIKNVSEATGIDKEDIEEELKDMKEQAKDIELSEKVKISIYTRGLLNKLSGVEISVGKYFEASILSDGNSYEGELESGGATVSFTAEKSGKEHKLTVKANKEKIATGTIRELSREKVDLDIEVKEQNIKLTVYIAEKIEKNKVDGEVNLKLSQDKENLALESKFGLEAKSKLDKENTSNSVKSSELTEDDAKKINEKLDEIVKKDKSLNALYQAGMSEIEDISSRGGSSGWDDDDDWGDDWDYDYDKDDEEW